MAVAGVSESMLKLFIKIRIRLRYDITKSARGTWLHPFLHSSYWHYLIFGSKDTTSSEHYFAARPNAGAGIGHQLANWIAGYWWARQFGLKYAHIPFSNSKWEYFFGFGENEAKVEDLLKKGYKKIVLPYFDQHTEKEIAVVKQIIKSYSNQKIVFIAEQDQDYTNQQDLQDILKKKFNSAPARKSDTLIYKPNYFNIAIHIRRTVVIDGVVTNETDRIKSQRWLASDYYEKVLQQVLNALTLTKPIAIYVFSTGKPEEFVEFTKYGNVRFCSDMDEYTSFLHLVRADLLITSKSSFSYKPALISNGVKICPRNFWHGYPETKNWILVENDGNFDVTKLS
jgi:hypothetical protein